MCALVRQGAFSQKNRDLGLGVFLGILGGAASATGTAIAAQQGNSSTTQGGWAAVAGLGVVTTAAAIYFLVKSGNDRQEYWIANAAVAKIHADYAQYPVMMTDEMRYKYEDLQTAPPGERDEKVRAFEKLVLEQRQFQATLAGHTFVANKAAEYKKLAADQLAQAAARDKTATLRDSDVTAALATYQAALAVFQKLDPLPASPTSAQSAAYALAQRNVAEAKMELTRAKTEADQAHNAANAMAIEAAKTGVVASDAMNAMLALQGAWSDCSSALQAIGSSDGAASAAFAAGLGSGSGGGKSGGGGGGGGGGSGASAGGGAAAASH